MTINERAEQVSKLFSYRYGYVKPKEAYIEGATEWQMRTIEASEKVFASFVERYLRMLPPSKQRGRDTKYETELFVEALKNELTKENINNGNDNG